MATHPVETLYRTLLTSWNAKDAAAYGALFVAEGTIVGFDGSSVASAAEITAHLAGIFADHDPAAYVAVVTDVRDLAPGVVLLQAAAGLIPPSADEVDGSTNAVQALVAVQTDAGWRIAHFQNTPAQLHGRPEAVEAMTAELQAAPRA